LSVDGRLPIKAPTSSLTVSTDERLTGEPTWSIEQVLRTQAFWLLLTTLFVVSIGTSGTGVHLVPHLTQQGLSAQSAVGAISVMFTAGALASLGLGLASERVSPRLLMALAYLLVAVSLAILISADTITETYLFAVIMTPPTTRTWREPIRSTNHPLTGARVAPKIAPRVAPPAICVRVQPSSSPIGMTKILRIAIATDALAKLIPAAAPTTNHP